MWANWARSARERARLPTEAWPWARWPAVGAEGTVRRQMAKADRQRGRSAAYTCQTGALTDGDPTEGEKRRGAKAKSMPWSFGGLTS